MRSAPRTSIVFGMLSGPDAELTLRSLSSFVTPARVIEIAGIGGTVEVGGVGRFVTDSVVNIDTKKEFNRLAFSWLVVAVVSLCVSVGIVT